MTIFSLFLDDASQMDLFQRDSDNEDENESFDETEVKWRKERFEREQWLRAQVLAARRASCPVLLCTITNVRFWKQ